MPDHKSKPQTDPRENSFGKLIRELKPFITDTVKTGSQALNEDRLNAYWEIGRRLRQERATSPVAIVKIARGLQITASLLYRANHFHATWPRGLTKEARQLSWRLHLIVNGINNLSERDFYVRRALERGLNAAKLKREIANKTHLTKDNDDTTGAGLARDSDPLHVYKALVEKITDGDTLDVRIDVGFNLLLTSQTVRLRGLNAAELPRPDRPTADALRARKAKAFVAEKLKGVPFVVVKTHKSDIYGRFVVDLFYHPKFTDKRDVARKGFFLNAELLQAGLAVRVMD